jgi:hypothetical protein
MIRYYRTVPFVNCGLLAIEKITKFKNGFTFATPWTKQTNETHQSPSAIRPKWPATKLAKLKGCPLSKIWSRYNKTNKHDVAVASG